MFLLLYLLLFLSIPSTSATRIQSDLTSLPDVGILSLQIYVAKYSGNGGLHTFSSFYMQRSDSETSLGIYYT